jgi:N-acyl-phosphatidylethanolamine-hydrolysing phospholipase D
VVLRGRDIPGARAGAGILSDGASEVSDALGRAAAAEPPHHAPDGTFRNPWPDSAPHDLRDVVRMLREFRTAERVPDPPRGSFPSAIPDLTRPRAARDVATATWIGHSTVLLQVDGLNVITDPVFSERASPVQWAGPRRLMPPAIPIDELPPLDVVLLSHSHYDHLDKPAVKAIARRHPGATWVTPLRLGAYLRGWGAREIVELDWWQSAEVKGMTVTGTPARHFSARRFRDRNRTLWSGYALAVADRRIYFAGDSAYHPEFRAIGERCGPFDLALVPIGAYDPRWFMQVVHMDPEEAVQAYQELCATHSDAPAPLMLGIHWGTFRLTAEAMDEPPRRAAARWAERGLSADRLWIARFGETRRW